LKSNQGVKESLEYPEVYDLHVGKRQDVGERVVVDGVIYHIPMLKTDGLYILWKCICERQSRLPLAKDDIKKFALKMGYKLESESIQKEVEHRSKLLVLKSPK
jgi:hypothetical protein